MFYLSKKWITVFIFLFSLSLTLFGADSTNDKTTVKNNKTTVKNDKPNVKIDKKDEKVTDKVTTKSDKEKKKDPSKLKKEQIAALKLEMKKYSDKVNASQKKISTIEKQIAKLNQDLVKFIPKDKVEQTQKKKVELLGQKLGLVKDIKEYNFNQKKLEGELKLIDDNFEVADGTLNWSKVWDISDKRKYNNGKWSITVKSVNESLNESNEEAINIKIDPKSDIPTLNIINPVNNARVPGNLKVVGTAIDDDGIDKILLWVDNEKEPRLCEGKDFWYYDLDTTNMKDGEHKIRVKAYDITYNDALKVKSKGNDSYLRKESANLKEYTVKFKLDRRTPVIDIKTMKSGAIVSGVMNMGGEAYDDNTIVSMEYSTDDRVSFNDIPILKYLNNARTKVAWDIRVNSESLVDGIQTIWIRAKDGTGSVGYSPLTITVDHKKPQIRIDYPLDKSVVDGTFNALGFVKDNVEVKGISFAIEGAGTDGKFKEVKLLPGNPYWSYPVNMSKLKDGKYKLIAKVEDVAGNIETSSVVVTLETDRDKPSLKLRSIKKDQRYSTSVQIYGDLSDDDGCKSVILKVFKDGGKTPVYNETLPAKFYFSKDLDISDKAKFQEGKYTIELTPIDIFDVVGIPITENFVIDREFPTFDTKTIDSWAAKYFPVKINIPVKVIEHGGLKKLTYSIVEPSSKKTLINKKELKFKESKPGIFDSDNIVEDLTKIVSSVKVISIKLEAIDFLDNTTVINVPIIIDSKQPTIKDIVVDQKGGLVKDQVIDIDDNLMLSEVVIEFVSPGKKDPEKTVINNQKIREGYSKEFQLKVKSSDGKSMLDYSFNIITKDLSGNELKKSYKIFFKDTKASTHKITFNIPQKESININEENTVLCDDNTFSIDGVDSQIYSIITKDSSDLKFKYQTQVEEVVTTTDNKGKKIENKITKTVFKEIPSLIINKDMGIIKLEISKDMKFEIPVGVNEVKYFIVDNELNESEFATFSMINDNENPKSSILWPPSYANFNDSIFVYGVASDDNAITIQYSVDSETNFQDIDFLDIATLKNEQVPDLEPLKRGENISLLKYIEDNKEIIDKNSKLFKVGLTLKDFKYGEHYVIFKIKDIGGKEITKKVVVFYDNKLPKLSLWTPKSNEIVNGEITLRGDANDDRYISNVVVLHNGKEQVCEGTKVWETIYNLNTLIGVSKTESLNLHTIEMFVIDSAGNKEFLKNDVRIDTTSDAPIVYVNNPSVPDQRFTDLIEIGGVALDDDGVEYVQFRIYNSNIPKERIDILSKWERIDMVKGNPNWNKKIPKESLEAGRHILEVQAIDIYGLKGKVVSIPFHLDLENPQIRILSPQNGTYLEGEKIISGRASDPNGIDYVEVSTNYGWTFVKAEGQESWRYSFDSRSVPDGSLRLLIRAKDKAGSEAFSFALYNIDNKKPEMEVLMPKEKMLINNKFKIIGRAKDNIALDSVKISINSPEWLLENLTDSASYDEIKNPSNIYRINNFRFEHEILEVVDIPEFKKLLTDSYIYDKDNESYILKKDVKDEVKLKLLDILIVAKYTDGLVDVKGDTKEAWFYDIDTTDWALEKNSRFQLYVAVKDMAGNMTEQTVNFEVSPLSDLPIVELDQPQPGQHLTGDTIDFNGTVFDDDGVAAVYVKIDNRERVKALINGNSWSYSLPTFDLDVGLHKVMIIAYDKNEDGNEGNPSGPLTRLFNYSDSGPVIEVTSHINGKPMEHRPWLSGTSRYYERDLELKLKKQIQTKKHIELKKKFRRTPEKIPNVDTIEVKQYELDALKSKYLFDNRVKNIYLSIDNGKTYEKNIGSTLNWQTRVQTQYLKEGYHMLQIKAVTYSGKETINYFRTLIDRNIPTVSIDIPVENQALNESILVRGAANDEKNIKMVKIALRPHDKDLGKIPKFIQGIYLWTQMFSGPWISAGFGLSFFDDVVRLEALYGWTPTRSNIKEMGFDRDNIPEIFRQSFTNSRYEPRFSGFTAGGKLLARIIDIPFEFFWGEDARNFSWSVEIGAGFYWFSGYGGVGEETNNTYYRLEKDRDYDPLKDGKLLAGFMYQVDFFKVERWGIFRKFALYFENSFYFIASEVEGGLVPQIGIGIRNAFF